MPPYKQILIIFILSIGFGILRFIFMDDPEFTLIKKERIMQKISTFSIPEDMTEPMAINLEFSIIDRACLPDLWIEDGFPNTFDESIMASIDS